MKTKGLFIGALIAMLCFAAIQEASAHGRGCRRGGYRYGGGYGYRQSAPRVWVAPPPPVVVVGPRYGYHHRHYARPRYNRGYAKHYGPRRW